MPAIDTCTGLEGRLDGQATRWPVTSGLSP